MSSIKKQILKCKHPNSRKTLALSKRITKTSSRQKQKMGQYLKQNLVGEKVSWFRDNLASDITVCTPDILENLIETYLIRFDEELEQIKLKHSIGNRKNRQHANREDVISITNKREMEEYNTCGFEVPDLLNNHNLSVLQKWTGELRFLQNIKMKRYSKKKLQQLKTQITKSNLSNDKTAENSVDVKESAVDLLKDSDVEEMNIDVK